MKADYKQKGETLNYTNPTDGFVAAGTLVVFGDICGIAATDMAPGQLGTIATTGVWDMPKDNAAITGGSKVYYNKENNIVTATASTTVDEETVSNIFVGIAIEDTAAGASTVAVRLNG